LRGAPSLSPFAPSLPTSCLPLWRIMPALQLRLLQKSVCDVLHTSVVCRKEPLSTWPCLACSWLCGPAGGPGAPSIIFFFPLWSDDTWVVRKKGAFAAVLQLSPSFPGLSRRLFCVNFSLAAAPPRHQSTQNDLASPPTSASTRPSTKLARLRVARLRVALA
jgi:hypothetical protein